MKKLALVLIIVVALAFPALALAKKIKLSGGVVHDKDSRVTLTVVTKDKQPKAIKHMKLKASTSAAARSTRELREGHHHRADPGQQVGQLQDASPNVNNPSEKLRVSGKRHEERQARQRQHEDEQADRLEQKCDVPKQHFELSK